MTTQEWIDERAGYLVRKEGMGERSAKIVSKMSAFMFKSNYGPLPKDWPSPYHHAVHPYSGVSDDN